MKTVLRNIICSVQKEKKEQWKRLLKSEAKHPYIKVDWNKWVDEDDISELSSEDEYEGKFAKSPCIIRVLHYFRFGFISCGCLQVFVVSKHRNTNGNLLHDNSTDPNTALLDYCFESWVRNPRRGSCSGYFILDNVFLLACYVNFSKSVGVLGPDFLRKCLLFSDLVSFLKLAVPDFMICIRVSIPR